MVTERRLVRILLSTLDTSRSLSQNTVASLNSYRSHVRVKRTRFVRSVDRISALRTAGGTTKKHTGTANRLLFCFVSTRCLVYYFLLFLDPNLTVAYLAMLAGL